MKKILIIVGFTVLLFSVGVYLLIPKVISTSQSVIINANPEGAFRYLATDSNLNKWWPGKIGETAKGNTSLFFNEYVFQMKEKLYNSFKFTIGLGKDTISNSIFALLPIAIDSFKIEWNASIPAGINPFQRIRRYFFCKNLGENVQTILKKIADHCSQPENIYGLNIHNEKVPFQHFISTYKTFDTYPSLQEIYQLINSVKRYILDSGAKEQFQPILNISTIDSIHYKTQVAIAIDRELPGTGDLADKWMMKNGNILVADVTGGADVINSAFRKMEKYITENHRVIMAIPFQMLITNRLEEQDSTKWVTRLYYPVM